MLQKRMQSESFQVKFPILRLNDQAPSIVSRLCDPEQQIRCKGQMVSPIFVSKSVDSNLCKFFFALNIL